jgi:hypothetical protein
MAPETYLWSGLIDVVDDPGRDDRRNKRELEARQDASQAAA